MILLHGLRLAVSVLTVLPVRAARWDRPTAAVAMTLAPLVGAGLGAVLGGIGSGLRAAGATPLLAAAVIVAAGALLTRGMHLDGLADTADGLGTYGAPERALAVAKAPDVGAFGVIAIGCALLVQVAALASVPGPVAVIVAVAGGRLSVPWACRRGTPAARPDGLGATVAGTVPPWALAVATVAVLGLCAAAVPGRPWQGPLAVLVSLLAGELLVRHCVRRFGGITGDVIGASVEITTTVALVGVSLGGNP
ncbi:adenosylcobinamide-GDP ribazoletransferase [Virgisporangium aliadipatigenens]|uniref:Adenosylcobinamide-GDP ribazoletransferase n=1 Tax=Virgisporangium aliadipatigenens TaxID=741659 RepID=A0A8J3YVD6_9ACTN|nr:adenosylcobinamide-GDP ribazoletransferase [Virgisporangium aliadipatigenens]GIJ50496.1 adenosylcobinamide-GDP ribazoletransferase [Virgisporangium aliadipatigenens]